MREDNNADAATPLELVQHELADEQKYLIATGEHMRPNHKSGGASFFLTQTVY
jgi:hypothetical protein